CGDVVTITRMALEFADLPVRPITVDQALRMVDAGIFEDEDRLELLLGVLVEKPVSSPEHVELETRMSQWLWTLGPRRLRLHAPLVASDGISMPEPDL